MRKTIMALSVATSLFSVSCTNTSTVETPIGRSNIVIEGGVLTPESLFQMGKMNGGILSPDGTKLLYSVTYYDIAKNKGNTELFTISIHGGDPIQLTSSVASESNAAWIADGAKIAYLSSQSGSSQLWVMNANGTDVQKISNVEGGIDGFIFSPDEKQVFYYTAIKYGKRSSDIHPDLPMASGRVIDDLMYKHWDEWVETIPHPFIATFEDGKLGAGVDIMEGEPYECPMKPFGGVSDFAWSPDSKQLVYVSRKKEGLEYSISTNSDLYLYDLASKQTTLLTQGMMGYDTHPVFSPDGTHLAWLSMERDGYESDKNRVIVRNLATGNDTDVSANFDYSANQIEWNKAGNTIYARFMYHGTEPLFAIDIATQQVKQITDGHYDYASLAVGDGVLYALRHSMSQPNELYAVSESTGEATPLTFENKHIFDQLKLGKVEERWITTSDNKKMLTWVIYPPDFDPNKKYPALLYCQGGPQSPVSQFWSNRWNPQLMAANGYIVVAPNRRGLYGFGQEWLEQISGDYGGQNMRDYFSAIDALKVEPYVDENRLGAVGASYGGFSVYWLAGNHEKRFKTFIAHAGIFNLEQQYVETEEMWFANWDMGGPYWDATNKIAQNTYKNSPHRFVDRWDTPILVIHGEKDFRILASQGMAAFNAAQLRGIPSQMLIFPDENHWISQPQNSILWQRTFFGWLDRWLK